MANAVAAIVGRDPVGLRGEIGAVAYFCECEIVDDLSDMAALNTVVNHDLKTTTGLPHALLRFNYRHRDLDKPRTRLRYLLQATNDPDGQPWRWPATSPWIATPRYYVLTRVGAH